MIVATFKIRCDNESDKLISIKDEYIHVHNDVGMDDKKYIWKAVYRLETDGQDTSYEW